MGWSGMKIPGHSGTQFKNRKAFKNKLKPVVQNKKQYTPGENTYPEYSYSELQQARSEHKKASHKMLLWICIPSAILFVFYMNYLDIHFLPKKLVKPSPVHAPSSYVDTKSYDILVEAGYIALKENRLNDAQNDFVQALKTNQYGKHANLGLTKTLSETCRQRGRFCDEAAYYYDFTKRLEDVTEADLNKLGVGAFF